MAPERNSHLTVGKGHVIIQTALYALTLFLGAGLLFAVQPMAAKQLLPRFGGAPAVWNSCLFFFQTLLLAGYAWTHLLTLRLSARVLVIVQLTLLLAAATCLPLTLTVQPGEGIAPFPALAVLLALAGMVAVPAFLLAMTAPLLQRWYATGYSTTLPDPYFLYAASNAGSLLALLAYPLLLEPTLDLEDQARLWRYGFGVFAVLVAVCGVVLWRAIPGIAPVLHSTLPQAPVPLRLRLWWLWLALAASSLLQGVTTHITTNVAPVPALWILPLGIYLLTFVLAFGKLPALVHRAALLLLPGVVLLIAVSTWTESWPLVGVILLHLTGLFVTGLVCHGELARTRPTTDRLTEFYLWVALGGALGSLGNALVAPLVFDCVVEYPLVLVAVVWLMPRRPLSPDRPHNRWWNALIAVGVATCAAVLFAAPNWFDETAVLYRERTFFGVLHVLFDKERQAHLLVHGNIEHGLQFQSPEPEVRRTPLLYYHPTGPAGRVFTSLCSGQRRDKVGVVGLGIGSLAGYLGRGQEITFFEIDSAVVRIARNPRWFTCLADAETRGVRVRIVPGDARLSLRSAPGQRFGLLVVDAFQGDAVPVHLLTREALALYMTRLEPGGWLLLHLSNDHLDLEPVVAALAQEAGLAARICRDESLLPAELAAGKFASRWAVLTRREADLGPLATDPAWTSLSPRHGVLPWTDRYTPLLPIMRGLPTAR